VAAYGSGFLTFSLAPVMSYFILFEVLGTIYKVCWSSRKELADNE
jgi:hypothetical protein